MRKLGEIPHVVRKKGENPQRAITYNNQMLLHFEIATLEHLVYLRKMGEIPQIDRFTYINLHKVQ